MNTVYLCMLICAITGLLCASRTSKDRSSSTYSRKEVLIYSAIFGCLIGAFIGTGLASVVFPDLVPRREEISAPVTLAAMRSSEGTAGTFVWGSGSVGSELTYNFYVRHPDGSLSPGQVPANSQVYIIEDKNLHGVGYWRTFSSRHNSDSPLAPWALFRSGPGAPEKEEFRVPVGTVLQDFRVK